MFTKIKANLFPSLCDYIFFFFSLWYPLLQWTSFLQKHAWKVAVYSKVCTSYIVDTGNAIMNEAEDFRKKHIKEEVEYDPK